MIRQWKCDLHEGPVTTILLDPAEGRVITGGADRLVCISPIVTQGDGRQLPTQRLQLTVRCRNVQFEGIRPQHEQDLLRSYSAI